MRIGQMARRLAVSPSEIIQYLASNDIMMDDNVNTRLDDIQIELVRKKFAPSMDFTPPVIASSPEPRVPNAEVASELSVTADIVDPSESKEIKEVIKASKIALSGLKVLGKIELSEQKNKEEETRVQSPGIAAENFNDPAVDRKDSRVPKKVVHTHRPYKNPIALTREREMQEELARRKEKAALEKEKKTQRYLKKVKLSPPTKAVRLVDEPVMQMTDAELKEDPKSWWGKFVKWIST